MSACTTDDVLGTTHLVRWPTRASQRSTREFIAGLPRSPSGPHPLVQRTRSTIPAYKIDDTCVQDRRYLRTRSTIPAYEIDDTSVQDRRYQRTRSTIPAYKIDDTSVQAPRSWPPNPIVLA